MGKSEQEVRDIVSSQPLWNRKIDDLKDIIPEFWINPKYSKCEEIVISNYMSSEVLLHSF